jgi:Secretion system C-terminal sorting domain
MKYNILLVVVLLLFVHSYHTQAQCVNGTETNPTAPLPLGAGFKTNTFNWRQNPIPLTGKFLPQSSVNNPFFNVSNLQALQGGLESDSKPEEGWQLIKQDFGYAYSGNTWQGQSIFNATGSSQPGRAYMMLYNKYSSILRIIGIMDRLSLQDQIIVVLTLKDKSNTLINYQDFKFNALFNRYNAQQTGLDLPTKVTSVTAPAQAPSTGADFFYADFNVSYDPCVCFFQSAIEVSFRVKQTSTLKLTGRILGQNVDITQKNALPNADYLTSVWNNNTPNQPYNQMYSSMVKLQSDIKDQQASSAFADVLGYLGKAAKVAKLYSANFATDAIFSNFTNANPKIVQKAGKFTSVFDFVSFFMGGNEKASNPTVITAELAATGVIQSISNANSNNILIGTPGSQSANLLPEYPTSTTGGIKPMYPMYNEMVGRFAVVRTPQVMYSLEQTGNGIYVYYKLSDILPTFSYTFNPVVDAEKTKIFVALEFEANGNGNFEYSQKISKFLPIQNARQIFDRVTTTANTTLTSENINIVFQIFYQFKPDANGNVRVGYDVVKVKPNVSFTPTNTFTLDPRFIAYFNTIPTDLNVNSTVFSQGQTIYSFGDITISGNLTNNSSNPIIIIAEGEVNINPGVNITGNIEFRSGQILPPGFPVDPPLPPMTANEIQTFCTSSQYKAKDQTLALTKNEPTADKDDVKDGRFKTLNFSISPNPFTDQIIIDLNIEEATTASLNVTNAIGQTLKTVNLGVRETGSYQETIETSDLAPGVYLLTLRTQNGVETKKIIKQ